eukprot:CAMPEP_0182437200 /NCGR_PEP_ID=MMETSP1167-20130531/84880_1 /TAXON_ID=2988 /ORGANISM="Mallomonas Sp, Strain CCMP3275" /LENGTH=333 /DNA_ID=CAMNT_0024630023 /DNA_START=48 /DNA_END=1049 /DNA_ORIENTATION=+
MSNKEKNGKLNVADPIANASFEVVNVLFHSITDDKFRVKVTHKKKEIAIWIESKKSRKQYQITINDITEHGLVGIPESAVVLFIQKSLEACVSFDEDLVKAPAPKAVTGRNAFIRTQKPADKLTSACDSKEIGSNIDLQVHQDKAILSMLIDFGGMWKQECMFELRSVPLEPVDILSAQLRDAQEEIASLKQAMMQIQVPQKGLSLATLEGLWNTQTTNSYIWGKVDGSDTSLVTVSKDGTGITVNKAGWYQVTVNCVVPAQYTASYPGTPGYSLVISSSTKTFMKDLIITKSLSAGSKVTLAETPTMSQHFAYQGGSREPSFISFLFIAEVH